MASPFKTAANRGLWLGLLGSLLVAVALFAGCGGSGGGGGEPNPAAPWGGYGSKEAWEKAMAEQRKQAPGSQKAAPQSVPARPPATAVAAPAPSPPSAPVSAAVPAAPAPPFPAPQGSPSSLGVSLPAAPADLSAWKESDFLVARIRRDPALLDALNQLGRQRRSDEQGAKLLTRLLVLHLLADLWEQPAAADATEENQETSSAKPDCSHDERLVETLVAALARSSAPSAKWALSRLITGSYEARDRQAIALAALRAVAAELDRKENENLFFALLAEPERLGPGAAVDLSLAALRKEALTQAETAATAEFRLRAARKLADRGAPPETRALLGALIGSPSPVNLEAQVFLFQSGIGPAATENPEALFSKYASSALASLAGLPEKAIGAETDADWPYRIAAQFWTPGFHGAVHARLARTASWTDSPEMFALAAAIPNDGMRRTLHGLLSKQWPAGPGALAEAWTAEGLVTDPGLQVILKSCARAADGATAARVVREEREPDGEGIAQQREEIQRAWADLAEKLSAKWLQRWRAASLADSRSGRAPDRTGGLAGLPLELHSVEHVVATHRLDWPGAETERLAGVTVSPLHVQYVRIEETARPEQLLALYRRRLPKADQQRVPGGVCLAVLDEGSVTGRLRSIDLRITRAVPDAPTLSSEPQGVVIELLVVEIAAPSEAS